MGKKNSKIYLFSHAAILHECATKIEVIQLRFSCTDSNNYCCRGKLGITQINLAKMAAVIKVSTRMSHQCPRYLNAMKGK